MLPSIITDIAVAAAVTVMIVVGLVVVALVWAGVA